MPFGKRRRLAASLILAGCVAALPAAAHRATALTPEEAAGVEIPGLTHGEMRSVEKYRPEILRLAASQYPTDAVFRRLLNHANIQLAYCAWGFVPNAMSDETSPFNECSHAYLSGYRAVLSRMAEMSGQAQAAQQLADRIDAAIRADPEAEALCQYSIEPFYTGSVVAPTLADIVRYPPAALFLATVALTMVGLALGGIERRRRAR